MGTPAPVWLVVIRVFQWLDKLISVPIRYSQTHEKFYVNERCFRKWYKGHVVPYRLGALCVLLYFLRIVYKVFIQIVSPERNKHLNFGLLSAIIYTFGFLICLEAVFCIWTLEFRVIQLVDVLNVLLKTSVNRPSKVSGSKITFFGYICFDISEAIAIVAALGFMGFPCIAILLPLVEHDPASHIARTLMPPPAYSNLMRIIFAMTLQGSVAAFGAIICLQILFIYILVVDGMSEQMSLASTDKGLKLNLKEFQSCTNLVIVKTQKPSLNHLAKDLNTGFGTEANFFRPVLLIHRQLTIIQQMSSDALVLYTPGLLFVGMSLIIVCSFFYIRFVLPLAVVIPNTVIYICVSFIICGLVPVAEKLDVESATFKNYWSRRLKEKLQRKLLESCRHCVLIRIWIFASYRRGILLDLWNVMFQQLANLLLNFRA